VNTVGQERKRKLNKKNRKIKAMRNLTMLKRNSRTVRRVATETYAITKVGARGHCGGEDYKFKRRYYHTLLP